MMYVTTEERVDAGEGPVESVLKGEVERQIITLLERHFKGSAHLVELELLMRLPREEMTSELENLYRAGLVSKDTRVIPGARPYMTTCVYSITDKGVNALLRYEANGVDKANA